MDHRAIVAIALGIVCATCPNYVFPAQTAHVASFTSEQAAQGQLVFYEHCAECHGADLQGVSAPALSGSARSNLGSQSPLAVKTYIYNAMPVGNVGILRSAELVEVTAFLMRQNGRRPGRTPLSLASIDRDTTTLASEAPGHKVLGGR